MSVVQQSPPPFAANRVVVLSELSIREKDAYYDMLIKCDCKYRLDPATGKYIGNIRLLGPNVKRAAFEEVSKKVVIGTLPFEERLQRLHAGGTITVRIQGVESFDYNEFIKFVALISSPNEEIVKPKLRTVNWVMRTIEELYSARFAFEKNDIERNERANGVLDLNPKDSKSSTVSIFPVFVLRRMCTLLGLKHVVDQTCWDLLYSVHMYRGNYLEIELFARFLKEHYDYDDLLFFLYVRSVIAKALNINFKTRWSWKSETVKGASPLKNAPKTKNVNQNKSIYLSYRECVRIANIIYGTPGNEEIYRKFLNMVSSQLVGQLTEVTDSRRIDITQFLHLAVIGYHYAQTTGDNKTGRAGGEKTDLQLNQDIESATQKVLNDRRILGQYEDSALKEPDLVSESWGKNGESNKVDEYLKQMSGGYPAHGKNTKLGSLFAAVDNAPETDKSVANASIISSTDFIQLQMDREKEFLEFLCQPMESMTNIPGPIAQVIVDEIADYLRSKVNAELEGFEPSSLDEFDDRLVEILQAESFLAEVGGAMDSLLQFVLGRPNIKDTNAKDVIEFLEKYIQIHDPPYKKRLLTERTNEFMDLLCENVTFPDEGTKKIVYGGLRAAVSHKLREATKDFNGSEEQLDERIISVLQQDAFVEEMDSLVAKLI